MSRRNVEGIHQEDEFILILREQIIRLAEIMEGMEKKKCPICGLKMFKISPKVYICPLEHTKYADGKWYIRRSLYEEQDA